MAVEQDPMDPAAWLMGAAGKANPYIAAGSAALGLLNTFKGFQGLKKASSKPIPRYKEDAAMTKSRMRAEERARRGFTSSQTQAYENRIQRRYATQDQKIKDTAGSLGSYVAGVSGANRATADLEFAAQDAAMMDQNVRYADRFAENLQNLSNMNTQVDIQERQQAIGSYGQAAQTGLTTLAETVNNYSATGGFDNMFGGGANRNAGGVPDSTRMPDTSTEGGPVTGGAPTAGIPLNNGVNPYNGANPYATLSPNLQLQGAPQQMPPQGPVTGNSPLPNGMPLEGVINSTNNPQWSPYYGVNQAWSGVHGMGSTFSEGVPEEGVNYITDSKSYSY